MNRTNEAAIEHLLHRAGKAHGEYEETTLGGVYDEAWPAWYAQWLLDHGFALLVARPVVLDMLSEMLADLNAAHRATDGSPSWPAFYAEGLAHRLG